MNSISWLTCVFGFEKDTPHISIPNGPNDNGVKILGKMADKLVGTDELIALYIPLSVDTKVWPHAKDKNGRIVGTAKLIEKPEDMKIEDYYCLDWSELDKNGNPVKRWPIGWPCEVVHYLKKDECINFRHIVETNTENSFDQWTAGLQSGPREIKGTPISRDIGLALSK